jgi:hypothetical protein
MNLYIEAYVMNLLKHQTLSQLIMQDNFVVYFVMKT